MTKKFPFNIDNICPYCNIRAIVFYIFRHVFEDGSVKCVCDSTKKPHKHMYCERCKHSWLEKFPDDDIKLESELAKNV